MKMLKILLLIFFSLVLTEGAFCGDKEIQTLTKKLNTVTGKERLEVLNELATEYIYTSFILSEKYARLGLNESIAQKDTVFELRFYRKIGGVKQMSAQYDSAVFYYQKSAEIAIAINDQYQEALAMASMGNVYLYTYDYESSLKLCFSSVDAFIEAKDTISLSYLYNNIGTSYMSLEKLDSAEYFLKKAIQLMDVLDVPASQGVAISNLGEVYHSQNKFDQAEIELKKALQIFEKEKSIYNISSVCINLSELYLDLNKNELSELYLLRAVELSEEVGSIKLRAEAYQMLSELFENTNQCIKALDYHKKYMVLSDSLAQNKYSGLLNEMTMVLEIEKQERELESLNNAIIVKESKIALLWSVVAVFIVLIAVILLFYILNRRKNKILFKQSIKDLQEPEEDGSDELDEKIEKLYIALLDLFENKKVYLDSALTTNKLSELLNSNNNYVSKCINLKFGDNFNAVVNMYRVKEAKLLMQDEQYANYTIAAISDMCGFTSLSVFNRSFKKETGITPSYFLKSMRDGR